MAIVFPVSPTLNDTFVVGSITYKWDGDKWIGLGVTPADRLVEGSNSLEITAGNDLVWTGDKVGIKTTDPQSALEVVDNITFTSGDTMPQLRIKATSGALGKVMNIGLNETDDYGLIQTMDRGTGYSTALILQPYGTARVGIGAEFSDPDAKLEVRDSAATGVIIRCTNTQVTDSNKALRIRNNSSTDTFSISHKGLITVSGADGTSADTALFQNTTSGGNNRVRINCFANGGGDPYIKFDAGGSNMIVGEHYLGTTNNQLVLGVGETPSDTYGIRIDGQGRVAMGDNATAKLAGQLQVINDDEAQQTNDCLVYLETVGNDWTMRQNYNSGSAISYYHYYLKQGSTVGSITYNGTNMVYGTGSDYRLKENVVPLTGAIDTVKLLQPKKFNFISNPDVVVDGFIAHELQEVVPVAVSGEKDGLTRDGEMEPQQVDLSKLVPILTAALQEALAEIETLKGRLDAAGL